MVKSFSSVASPAVHFSLLRRPEPIQKVGIIAPHYGMEHVSYVMSPEGYQHVTLKRLPFQRLEKQGTFWNYTPLVLDASVPLIHTMNMLPLNGERFVVSYELEMPRYLGPYRQWQHQLGYRLMASNRCKALMCISEIGASLLRQQLNAMNMTEVAQKVSVFRGAVLPSLEPVYEQAPREQGPLKLLFIGAEAFRKGLIPTVDALEALRKQGMDLELTVISSLKPADYVMGTVCPSGAQWQQKLRELPWVTYHANVANAEVRQIIRAHDLLLLPSFDETLGWVIVEAGMEGVASIATNVFAFPEIIDDGHSGRMIPVQLNAQSRWRGLSMDLKERDVARLEDNEVIQQGLMRILTEVFENRPLVRQWGHAAYEKMQAMYNPIRSGRMLQIIYDQALSD
jgi:glycosyltransferase involved in cell wall biosynthesis